MTLQAAIPAGAVSATMPAVAGSDAARRREGGLRRFVVDLVGYGLASLVALACDYGLLLGLTSHGIHYLVASTTSFLVGLGVAYALNIRFVFADRRAASRKAEAVGFLVVGLLGLGLTQILLYALVSGLGLPVALAKVPTAGAVFLFNFLCRRCLVFVTE